MFGEARQHLEIKLVAPIPALDRAGTGARPLNAGEITNFVTRVASPPEAAKKLEIRFARADEIGSNTIHE